MKNTGIIRLLVVGCLLLTWAAPSWAVARTVAWQAVNRITNVDGNTFTTANNAANAYALALDDLSTIEGIGTVGIVNIQFYCHIPSDSRWVIGIGDKNIRGTNANGSTKSTYNTDGLIMRFGVAKQNNTFNVNGVETSFSPLVDRVLLVSFSYDHNAHTYSYELRDVQTNNVYYSAYGVSTTVGAPTLIEAYSWMNNTSISLSDVYVSFSDFYFPNVAEIAYIEDISYTLPLVNNTGQTAYYSFNTTGNFRQDGATLYPRATTGNQPDNDWEGDPIVVTANANGQQPTTYYLRFKTRNLINPANLCTSNTFNAGSTPGMFLSNTVTLDGMTLSFSESTNVPVVRSIGGDYGVTIIDPNSYFFAYIDNNSTMWGTVYKLVTTQAKKLHVTGYFSNSGEDCVLLEGNRQIGTITNPRDGSLATGTFDLEAGKTYYLYGTPYTVFAMKSLSYTDAFFPQPYMVTAIPADGHFQQMVNDMSAPVYSIAGVTGDLADKNVTINSSTGELSGLTAGGAVKVQATGGGITSYYVLTVAYPATDYPGHVWNFCEVQGGLNTADGLKAIPTPQTTTIDSHGDIWTAMYKINNRNPVWYHNNVVRGDNAFIVQETAGLIFNAGYQRFYLRNDDAETTFVGMKDYNSSLTIPQLNAGDIVEMMWRHDTSGQGTQFTATNVNDLRGKPVSEEFQITESARRSKTRYVGSYSFVATGGDVTFTLHDSGNSDLLSVRIYKGPYHPTMRSVNQEGNVPVPNNLIVDGSQNEGYVLNYCNQLYSTSTGPAMYVLKGYRQKTNDSQVMGVDYDHPGCVTGVNSDLSPTEFTDEDAYPVSNEESQRLYELRKNIIGLEVFNQPWQSDNCSYNFGRIRASGGWGKVTVRMNNYTNDLKYVIGYTPDYTLNIGSAPHQEYPYTWDFTNISGQAVLGQATNVYNTIAQNDQNAVNWISDGGGTFSLNTDNYDPLQSQYVPGAVLVTTEKALSNYNGDTWGKYALDELDGLGVDGKITIDTDSKTSSSRRSQLRRVVANRVELLRYSMDKTNYVDNGPFLEAGYGWIKFGDDARDSSLVATCGFSYKCDEDVGSSKVVSLTPSRSLKNGDIISIKAYATSVPTDNKSYGLGIYTENWNGATPRATMFIPNGMKNAEVEMTYTVSEGDGLRGSSLLHVFRHDGHSVYLTEVLITGSINDEPASREMLCETETTLTIPDVATGHRIYVSASVQPESVTGATLISDGSDAADGVWRYDVTTAGNVYISFPMGARIYKIGVTDILKTMHPVGGTGWATESRNHSIDHTLTGNFTMNEVNAYTVSYDSYDLNTATVALTPVQKTGYVPDNTGIVMRQDNNVGSNLYEVPLFYPSYTREAADIADDNMLVPVVTGGRQWYEVNSEGKQKFILTNVHWRYSVSDGWGPQVTDADAAGFYRLHIWGNDTKDWLPDNCAYLGVPQGELPVAVWNSAAGTRRAGTLGIRDTGDVPTNISDVKLYNDLKDAKDQKEHWFSPDGRRVVPLKKGLYITRGKKIIVR